MRTFVLFTMLAACASSADDDYPVLPGGQNPASGGTGSGTSAAVSGRVCVLADPRMTDACASTGAGGITVSLGKSTTQTTDSGAFTLAAPQGTNLGFTVVGPNIVPTTMPFSPATSIPVLQADLFDQVLAANGIVLTSGSGSIFGTVIRDGVPAAGIGVRSTPSPAFGPFFDGSTPTAWTLNETGARGVFFAPGIATGMAQVTLTDLATSRETTVDGIQVINGGITVVDTVLP